MERMAGDWRVIYWVVWFGGGVEGGCGRDDKQEREKARAESVGPR